MRTAALVAGRVVGITGLIQIVLGVLFWTGTALALIPLHMGLGYVFVLAMWALAAMGFRARIPARSAVTLAWSLVVVTLGIGQMQIFPGAAHWVIRVLHLLVGLSAMGLAQSLAAQIQHGVVVDGVSSPSPVHHAGHA
jgi:hypothetical protein